MNEFFPPPEATEESRRRPDAIYHLLQGTQSTANASLVGHAW